MELLLVFVENLCDKQIKYKKLMQGFHLIFVEQNKSEIFDISIQELVFMGISFHFALFLMILQVCLFLIAETQVIYLKNELTDSRKISIERPAS